MEDHNACSNDGDSLQSSHQDDGEFHSHKENCGGELKAMSCFEEGLNDDIVEGMNQACASPPDVPLSPHCSIMKSEESFPMRTDHCSPGHSDDLEDVVVQCMVEIPENGIQNLNNKSIEEGKKELDIVNDTNDDSKDSGAVRAVEDEKTESSDNFNLPHLGGLYLDELDDDVLLHIASFLESRVVKFALSKVCVRFQDMFDNEAYWKSRILKRWPKKYPAVPPLSDFNWLDACVEREDSHRVWSDPGSNTRHFMYSCNVFAEVDSVHLMKRGQLLISGDRNRNMNIVDLSQYNEWMEGSQRDANFKNMLIHSDCATHKGWIWCMTSVDNHLMTGSWDMYIRLFDVNSQMVPFSSYKCKSAVLSLFAEENEIVASCFDKKVYFIDRRTSEIYSRSYHKQPVLSVAGNEQFIISGSEDKTISVFDRRAEKILLRIKLDHYPLCMSFRDNHLWFGDKQGHLHLYDVNQGLFKHIGVYDVGHKDKVTGVISTRGAIFTCSGDKSVKVHTPSQDPDLIASLEVHRKEIAWLDYSHGVLVSAGGEDGIGVWLPKHWDVNTYLL